MRKFFFLCFFLLTTGLVLNAQTNFKKNALTAAIVVSDEAKALHFYRDILGMQEAGGFASGIIGTGRPSKGPGILASNGHLQSELASLFKQTEHAD